MSSDKPDLHAIETEKLDPFDPAALRISQDFAASAGVEQVLATVPVRKPGKQDFVRPS